MKIHFTFAALTVFSLALIRPVAAQLPHYTISDQGGIYPDTGYPTTLAAVTRNGYSVGYYTVQTYFPPYGPSSLEDYTVYAVIAKNGVLQSTGALGLPYSNVKDINDNGSTTGNAANYEYPTTAFAPHDSRAQSFPVALNEQDEAIGYTYDFKYTRAWYADLWGPSGSGIGTLPGDSQNTPAALSDNGIVVGVSGYNFDQYNHFGFPPPQPIVEHAYIWRPAVPNGGSGVLSALPTRNAGENSQAFGVNDLGDVVGVSGSQSVLWPASGGVVSVPSGARRINNRGEIDTGSGFWTKNGGIQSVYAQILNAGDWSSLQITKNYLNGEFAGTGTHGGVTRIFRLTPVPVTISGKVVLEGAFNPAQSATFTLRPTNGAAPTTITQTLGADGSFTLSNISPDNYTILIHAARYLQKFVSVSAITANVMNVAVTLPAGDANNDNSIDSTDFGVLIGAFNTEADIPGGGYDPNADFNGDGFVDSSDFDLLIGNYGMSGDL